MVYSRNIAFALALSAVFVLFASQGVVAQTGKVAKVGEHGILHKGAKTVEIKVIPSAPEQKKKEVAGKQFATL